MKYENHGTLFEMTCFHLKYVDIYQSNEWNKVLVFQTSKMKSFFTNMIWVSLFLVLSGGYCIEVEFILVNSKNIKISMS